MSVPCNFSVTVWKGKTKVLTLNEVRENRKFAALREYLVRRRLTPCKVNLYYKGVYQYQMNISENGEF